MAIHDILIKIKGNNSDFKKKLGESDKSMGKFASGMKKHSAAIKGGLILIGVAALAMSAKIASGNIKAGVAMDKMSKSTGVAVEQLGRLQYAADQEHTSIETVNLGMKKLSKTMYDASEGLAESERTFAALGISIYNVDGSLRSVDGMMLETADIFKGMTDDTKKAALAQELFGRSGMEMIPMLELGREGIESLGDEAERLGIVLTGTQAKDMKAFDDQMTKLKAGFSGVGMQLTTALMPTLMGLADWFSDMVDKGYIDRVVSAFKVFGGTVLLVLTPLKYLINSMVTLQKLFQNPMDAKDILKGSGERVKEIAGETHQLLWEMGRDVNVVMGGDTYGKTGTRISGNTPSGASGIGGGEGDAEGFTSGSMMDAARKGVSASEYSGGEYGQWSDIPKKMTLEEKLIESNEKLIEKADEQITIGSMNVNFLEQSINATIKNTVALNESKVNMTKRGS